MAAIPSDKVISWDGTPIAYERSGSGPPLILVSGAGAANPAAWPVFAPLAEHFTVYAVDRRGHGRSGDGPCYAIEREFEDIAAVVASLGEPACLLGYSFGGLCALEAALLTGGIRKLILYEPLSIAPPGKSVYREGFLDRLDGLLDAGDLEGVLIAHYCDNVGMSFDDVERFRASPAWQERVVTARTLPRELRAEEQYLFDPQRFKDLSIATLLLTGGDSQDTEKMGVEVVAAALPNRQIVVMPDQEHIAMYTAPDLFLQEVLVFIKGQR